MAKFNVNSNAYIIIYSVVMVVVVAVLLSVTSLSLQSRQNENMLNEKRQQIVKALGENPETAAYGDVVAEAAMLDKSGNKIEGKTDADIFNALMAFPNIIGILLLSPTLAKIVREEVEKDPRFVI